MESVLMKINHLRINEDLLWGMTFNSSKMNTLNKLFEKVVLKNHNNNLINGILSNSEENLFENEFISELNKTILRESIMLKPINDDFKDCSVI